MLEPNVNQSQWAELIWQHTGRQRAAAHRGSGQAGCWTRRAPYGSADPRAEKVRSECRQVGCLDVVHEIYAAVGPRLARVAPDGRVLDAGRFANAVIAREVEEFERRSRVSAGLPARPLRSDGATARIATALVASGDGPRGRRLISLFELMRAYAAGPADGQWPVAAWAAERGTAGTSNQVAEDIAAVLAVAESVAGWTWVSRHLDPGRRLIATVATDELEQLAAAESDLLWQVFLSLYRDARRGGSSVEESVRHSADRVFGYRVPKLNARLRDLVAEVEPATGSRPRRAA